MNKYLIIAIGVLLTVLFFSIRGCQNARIERDRLSDNQRTLFGKIDFYRTKDSLSAASVERLTLTKNELQTYCGELVETCKDLDIKVKRLQSANTTGTETRYEFKTVLRDSLRVRDSLVVDTIKCIRYRDEWLAFESCTTDGENFDVAIASRDTLVTIAHRVPRQFLFFRWGCKAIRQEVVSKNPHSEIIYTQYVELKK